MRTLVVTAMVLAAGAAACGGESKNSCVAGSSVECACAGGLKGVQTCQADGTFTVCACEKPNAAPTAPVAAMPPQRLDGEDLVCTLATASTDPDGDAVTYAFAWTKNGAAFTGATTVTTTSVVSAAATGVGDVFACTASASDGKATTPGNTVSTTIIAPAPTTFASCAAVKAATPAAADGLYDIDPDGAGPIAAVKLFCDMTNGGLTLVANIYDSAGDDAPNDTAYVVSGWQQTASGAWMNAATKVTRDASGTGSAAVSLAFVAALKASAGQQNLKMCFVHPDGRDTACRDSANGSMTLASYPTGNPKLTVYAGNTLPYTYGRLAGLAGTMDGYDASGYLLAGYEVRISNGAAREFGVGIENDPRRPARLVDVPSSETYFGVWAGAGGGKAYRPWFVDNRELSVESTAPDPQPAPVGFRLYVGP